MNKRNDDDKDDDEDDYDNDDDKTRGIADDEARMAYRVGSISKAEVTFKGPLKLRIRLSNVHGFLGKLCQNG